MSTDSTRYIPTTLTKTQKRQNKMKIRCIHVSVMKDGRVYICIKIRVYGEV